jgi:hypothetical protein
MEPTVQQHCLSGCLWRDASCKDTGCRRRPLLLGNAAVLAAVSRNVRIVSGR